jgi:hypothetical protein
VETYRGSIFQDLLVLELSCSVAILDMLEALLDQGTAFVKSTRPGVE